MLAAGPARNCRPGFFSPDSLMELTHSEWTWRSFALEWFLLLIRVECQFVSMALRSLD